MRIVVAVVTAALLIAVPARADVSTIKLPGAHPDYVFEAEPHLLLAPFDDDLEPGVGFRGTVEIVDNGFIPRINNTVGIGFGLDWTNDRVRLPVVMQWNFWLTERWSVFGEPGLLLDLHKNKTKPRLALFAGGRFHFSDAVALTMRVGYPTASVGVSFFL